MGYFCPDEGAANPKICPIGHFGPGLGNKICENCPQFLNCSTEGLVEPVGCRPGHDCFAGKPQKCQRGVVKTAESEKNKNYPILVQ